MTTRTPLTDADMDRWLNEQRVTECLAGSRARHGRHRQHPTHDAALVDFASRSMLRRVLTRYADKGSMPQRPSMCSEAMTGDANPYLAMALTLACGYFNMTEQIALNEATTGSGVGLDYQLPQGLPAALALLRAEDTPRSVLGERFVDVYGAIKDQAHLEWMTAISPWERVHVPLHG